MPIEVRPGEEGYEGEHEVVVRPDVETLEHRGHQDQQGRNDAREAQR